MNEDVEETRKRIKTIDVSDYVYKGLKYKCDNLKCENCYKPKKPSKRLLCKIGIHNFHRVEVCNGTLQTHEYRCRFCGETEGWGY